MQPTELIFYFFAALSVISAIGVVTIPSTTRALLSVIVTMFSLSAIYLLLGAPFIAMVHLIVYAGAILVLFLFVIMLQGVGAKDTPLKDRFPKGYLTLGIITGLIFLRLMFIVSQNFVTPITNMKIVGTVHAVGRKLFFEYLLPFELISILILVGIFAAVALAKKDKDEVLN